MRFKRVAIIGMGALGVMYGQQMARHLPKGMLYFVADPQRARRYKNEGIYCNGKRCKFEYIWKDTNAQPVDLLLFAVKAGALEQAIEDARFAVGPQTVVMSVLNGISSEEVLGAAYGDEKVLPCVVQGMDATKTGNRLEYGKIGNFSFGEASGEMTQRVRDVENLLRSVEIPPDARRDIQRHMWSKFMLNCGVNQAAAVYGVDYGGLQQPGPAREAMLAAMREVMSISKRTGIGLDEADIDNWMKVLDTLGAQGAPSMRQDVLARRKTEVELFAGTARRLGTQVGVPTPQNDAFYEALQIMEGEWN